MQHFDSFDKMSIRNVYCDMIVINVGDISVFLSFFSSSFSLPYSIIHQAMDLPEDMDILIWKEVWVPVPLLRCPHK